MENIINQKEVKHIASLARLGMSPKEIKELAKDLSVILDWVEKLKEIDVSGVEPLNHMTGRENIIRKDKINIFEDNSALIDLFPEKKDGYDKVKSVL